MSAKEIYREFSRIEPTLPIFSRDWWLDATAGPEGWDAAVVKKGSRIVAAMPYVSRRRFGLRVLSQPPLTPKLGPWFAPVEGKPAKKLGTEKDFMQALIDQMPRFDYFTQNWDCSRTNWLPFLWNGFQQTTCYTYVLPDLGDLDRIWSAFDNPTRAECNKASTRYRLEIRDDLPLEDFLALNRLTFERQGVQVPYSDDYVRRIDAACAERDCRKFLIAVDPEGRQHAGNYFVWDGCSAYGMMNGADPALRNSGATSLCMWAVIRHAAGVTRQFDFAGSMMEPIERFIRGFGAVQVPYFNIRKTPSRLLRIERGLRNAFGKELRKAATSLKT
jgi:hypothetical protein